MAETTVCVHIGARAHYLLPKALEKRGKLRWLITDSWIFSSYLRQTLKHSSGFIAKSLAGRFAPDIPSHKVLSFGTSFLLFEMYLRIRYKGVWQQIIARNEYFEKKATQLVKNINEYDSLLGISYTSLAVFKQAKQKSKKTILFQIDPAIEEENIVSEVADLYKNLYPTHWQKAPQKYWLQWKQECELADVILANSDWTKQALTNHGIQEQKIKIIPLPIEVKKENHDFKRRYPASFNTERPLRCLFLGTLTLRKGIHIVLDVARQLEGYPVQFILIGNSELQIDFSQYKNVSYKGVVSREETNRHYQQADVFLFPTLSDGFGLTQLEAMSWKLPVIASKYCGEVVVDGVNGLVLQQNTPEELFNVLLSCLQQPSLLLSLSEQSFTTALNNNVETFADKLVQCLESAS